MCSNVFWKIFNKKGVKKMGDRSIKKETKKKKKSDVKVSTAFSTSRPVMVQPELIKKEKKPR